MTRKVAIAWAAEDTAAALHARYRSEKVAEVRTRLHALWLLRQGQGPTAMEGAVGVSRNSIQQWLRWYRTGGHGPLLSDGGAGPAGGASNSIVMDWYKSGFGVAESTPCPPFGVL